VRFSRSFVSAVAAMMGARPPSEGNMPPTPCPWCHKLLAMTTARGELPRNPTPGALSLCCYCGGLALYTAELGLDPVELEALTIDPDQKAKIRRVQEAARSGRPS